MRLHATFTPEDELLIETIVKLGGYSVTGIE